MIENASYSGSNYFGNKDLIVDTWSFVVKDYLQTTGQYTLTVKRDKCIPVGDTFVGTSTAGGIRRKFILLCTACPNKHCAWKNR